MQKIKWDPTLTSIRNIAKSAGVSVGTAFNYMKRLGYKPYKPRRVQELLPNDYQQRCDFADKAMRELDFESVPSTAVFWRQSFKSAF